MRSSLSVTLAAVALAACGTGRGHDAPPCHGARRPANPYGSVLAPAAEVPAAPAAVAAGGCGARRP